MKFKNAANITYSVYQATYILDKKYDLAIASTKEKLQNTRSPGTREVLKKKLKWFEALSFLVKKCTEYKNKFGKPVNSLDDLIKSGLIDSIPYDTIGDGFYWDPEGQEPVSKNNPFELIKKRNPLDME